jgi:hypothetical protein
MATRRYKPGTENEQSGKPKPLFFVTRRFQALDTAHCTFRDTSNCDRDCDRGGDRGCDREAA